MLAGVERKGTSDSKRAINVNTRPRPPRCNPSGMCYTHSIHAHIFCGWYHKITLVSRGPDTNTAARCKTTTAQARGQRSICTHLASAGGTAHPLLTNPHVGFGWWRLYMSMQTEPDKPLQPYSI
jgi:hypothetical protein